MAQHIPASTTIPTIPLPLAQRRIRIGLGISLAGFVMFVTGIRPDIFGLDRSPVIGFIQLAVLLVGLAVMCTGGYLALISLWKDHHLSILAEIGQRLVATGYLVAVFAGMADIFGFGSHFLPAVPFFGVWQAIGVIAGQFIIGVGFLCLVPYGRNHGTPKQMIKAG